MRMKMMIIGTLLLTACTKTPVVVPGTGSTSAPAGATADKSGTVDASSSAASVTDTSSAAPDVNAKLDYPNVLVMALNGNHDAEFELGAMFHDGDGVKQDYGKAIEWYMKSAGGGNRQAAFNLGLMYINGEGTDKNFATARTWLIKASDLGDVRATFHLGQMAYLGQGGTQDFAKAYQYYLKSAMGGYADAEMNVGVMNIRGEGVPKQDVIEGYAWLKLANDAGNERAAGLFKTLNEKINAEQKKMGEERAAALTVEIRKEAGPHAA